MCILPDLIQLGALNDIAPNYFCSCSPRTEVTAPKPPPEPKKVPEETSSKRKASPVRKKKATSTEEPTPAPDPVSKRLRTKKSLRQLHYDASRAAAARIIEQSADAG